MTKSPDNLVLELLRSIRTDQTAMRSEMTALRDETNRKIGALAESMVSMRKDINVLTDSVNGMRAEIRMIALAVDEHTQRLDRIDAHLGLDHPRA